MIMPTAKRTSSAGTKAVSGVDTTEIIRIRGALAWRPSPGDMLDGKVVKLLARESEFGVYPVVVMDTGDATYVAVHAFHTILRDGLRELKAAPGDDLVIMYQGKLESKNSAGKNAAGEEVKRAYHSYVVISNGVDSTVEFTWDMAEDISDEPNF
jgi:hypothetical protein